MFLGPLLCLALLSQSSGEACREDAAGGTTDVSFLQHALKLGDRANSRRWGPPAVQTYSLFVKFHKVAGSTWRDYVDAMQGDDSNCSAHCGNTDWVCNQMVPSSEPLRHAACLLSSRLNCSTVAHSCTFHPSLGAIRQAMAGQTLLPANTSDLAGVANLWADSKRLSLLWQVEWARAWLPQSFLNKRILITTLLREPKERMRSYFYYLNENPTHEGFKHFLEFRRDFVAGNVTEERFEQEKGSGERSFDTMSILLRSCCEYETWLGEGSVEQAKLVLATQFDLVGITERMNDALVTLGRLYGFSPAQTARIGIEGKFEHDNTNTGTKLDWTDEELQLAGFVAAKSTEIYNFSQELFQRQYISLFGNEENLQKAVSTFERLDPAAAD